METSSGSCQPVLNTLEMRVLSLPNPKVVDLVLLKDKQAPHSSWPMARVTATFPGKDSHIRTIEVKINDQGIVKTFMQPVTRVIFLLPMDNSYKV